MSVYFITCRDLSMVKIGWAFEPRSRISALQGGNPYPLVIEALLDGEREVEAQVHERFADHRVRAEWFHLSPAIEAVIEANRVDLPKLTQREAKLLSRDRAWEYAEAKRAARTARRRSMAA
jgi:hypothetical protein